MAVVEHYTSRQMQITKDGTTILQVFICLYTDLAYMGSNGIPLLGFVWSTYRQDIVCSDIQIYGIDNTNCRVECFYSTRGDTYKDNRPEKIESWRCGFDFSTEVQECRGEGDAYYDYSSGGEEEWRGKYLTFSGGGEDDPNPPLKIYKPRIVYWEKFNLVGVRFTNLRDLIGSVNSYDFLRQLRRAFGRGKQTAYIDDTGNDTGRWLCIGISVEQVGKENFEVRSQFLYSGDTWTWNTPYGCTGVQPYPTMNFHTRDIPTSWATFEDDAIR